MDRCCTKGRADLEVRQHARERCHVIVIEDNVETVDQVRNCLQAAGYEVEFTIDAEKGLRRSLAAHYVVITVDRMLPGSQ